LTTQRIALQHGSFALQIEPETGGCITGFWANGIAVLRSIAAHEMLGSVRLSASYPLVPFSNRIGFGQFEWLGEAHTLAANFLPEPHAIHGVGWQQPWQVLNATPASARLQLCHRPATPEARAAWPFAFDCIQTFVLDGNGLQMELALTNCESQRSMPAGLGFHPYFVKRPGSHIAFAAAERWDMDAQNLPTVRQPSPGLDTDCADLAIDHCFEGCSGTVQLHDAILDCRITSTAHCLVVYTQPEKDFIAIEPVSHANNALGRHTAGQGMAALQSRGVKILQPGETVNLTMRIDVRRPLDNTAQNITQ